MNEDEFMAALERLVRAAMGSGAACFAEKAGRGELDPSAPLAEAFGDFPAEFLTYRPSLVDDVRAAVK